MEKKYQLIYTTLKQEILEKRYVAGEFLPTENELALRFQTSRPTVAKALDMLRQEHAIERRAGFGTVVLESKLSSGTKIGLLIPGLGERETFEPVCKAIGEEAGKHHWEILHPAGGGGAQESVKKAEHLCMKYIRERVDGVFFAPVEHLAEGEAPNKALLEQLSAAEIQVVLLGRDVLNWPDQSGYDLVGIDNIQAGYLVTTHLLAQGCRRMVFATRSAPSMTVRLRIRGCREALEHAGLKADALVGQYLPEEAESDWVKSLMSDPPDALVCANDATAAALMRQLLDAGVAIPDQLRVAGFDDVKYASLLSIPLTTYHQPCKDIGRSAVQAMQHRLQQPHAAPQRITLQGHLMIRQSTA